MGVDGLRLDAIPYLCEREGTNNENLAETHAVLKQMRAELDRRYHGKMFLAEANQWPEDVRPYFGDGDECHLAFHFPLMPRIYMAVAMEDRHPIVEIMEQSFVVNYAVEIVAIIVAIFSVINTLLASILDRTREIGVLRAQARHPLRHNE